MRRTLLLTVCLAALAWPGVAAAWTKQDVSIPTNDGIPLAATLYLPDGAAPAGGWPAIMLLHGLGGDRHGMNALAEQAFLPGEQYAVLTYDARGHGGTGGFVTVDGPREIADVREAFEWLAVRPDVSDTRIGAWGISYGGGAIWNAIVAGVPFAAAETCETWTDLYSALVPQDLSKSGVITGFLAEIPAGLLAPGLEAIKEWGLTSSNLPALRAFANERSVLSRLSSVTTPVMMMQGRRDFAFGIDQATRAYAALGGPKALWIGNHGHAPSAFPAADTTAMMAAGRTWFDRHLRGLPVDTGPAVRLAREGKADTVGYSGLPPTKTVLLDLPGTTRTIAQASKLTRTSKPTATAVEVFGRPVVRVNATSRGGWSRLIAVLTARTPDRKEIVVSSGGIPTKPGARSYNIRLINQATHVPEGTRFSVTIASSSSAQNPANLLYLDLPMAPGAHVTLGSISMRVPVLVKPISG
ncbi:MAG TPA: alpha/beta fold hydrolase [Gaiellaceae bacterium]|nr:alpha/beta fold hydrolase [Gaiellaceae bacterium]